MEISIPLFRVPFVRDQQRLEKVLERLHQDVAACRENFRRTVAECRKRCTLKILAMNLGNRAPTSSTSRMSMSKTWNRKGSMNTEDYCSGECNGTGNILANDAETGGNCHPNNSCNGTENINFMDNHPCNDERCHCESLSLNNNDDNYYNKDNFNNEIKASCRSCNSKNSPMKSSESRIHHSSLMDFREKYLDFDEFPVSCDNESCLEKQRQYFKMYENGRPYKFDYRQIFEFGQNNSEQMRLKRAFIEAIDSDISLLNKLQWDNVTDLAVDRCVRKAFEKHRQQDEKRQQMEGDECASLNLFPKLDAYDPNDDQLMDDMLKSALNYLRNDPKYVLASLPRVHRLPILMEWIRQRYGKRYTPEEIAESCQKSLPVFRAMKDVIGAVKVPKRSTLIQEDLVPYTNRDCLLKKVTSIMPKDLEILIN